MEKIIYLSPLLLFLTACNPTTVKVETQEVPVYNGCPEINVNDPPFLLTTTLNEKSPPEDIDAFYKADMLNLINDNENLRNIIKGYNLKVEKKDYR